MTPDKEQQLGAQMAQMALMENARVRKTWGLYRDATGSIEAKERGAKGGRNKRDNDKPLTVNAEMVNKMLHAGLNCIEIGNILNKTAQSIRDMKQRYSLPRDLD